MDAGDAIAIVAVVISLMSVYFSWRSARASDVSAAAAEKSANADHEQLMILVRDREQAAERARLHPWSARANGTGQWVVRYQGPGAYNVRVDVSSDSLVGNVTARTTASSHLVDGEEFTLQVSNRRPSSFKAEISWAESDEWEAARISQPLAL
jgi:hypothetical protein